MSNEIEPDDTKSGAFVTALAIPMIGNLNRYDDTDFYKISTTTGGLLNIQFDRSDAKTDGYYFYVYDNNNNYQGAATFQIDGHLILSVSNAGDYFLKVTSTTPGNSGGSWSSDPYTFTASLQYTAGTTYDGETTDLRSAAIVGDLDKPIIGNLRVYDDTDFYKITTTTSGVLNIQFDRSDAKSDGYYFYVYDSNNYLQGSATFQTDGTVKIPVSSAGDYTFKVTSTTPGNSVGSWSPDPYTFTASLQYTAGTTYDGEMTDLRSAAIVGDLDKPIIGNLKVYDDTDFYKITTTTGGVLNIQFDRSDAKTDGYYFYVYDSNNYLQGSATFQTDGTVKIPVSSAGDYTFKVTSTTPGNSGGSWSSDLYTFTPTLEYSVGTVYDGETTDLVSAAIVGELGNPITGNLIRYDDTDFYKISTTTGGVLNIQFDRSDAKTDGYYFYVYDSNNYLQGSATFQTDGTVKIPVSSAGNYTLKVTSTTPGNSGGSWSSDLYIFTPTLQYSVGTVYDGENADTFVTATDAILGKPIVGALASNDDDDYYKVTTTTSGVLNIVFDRSDAKTDGYNVLVYDSNHKQIGSSSVQTDGAINVPVPNIGSYFIKVQPSNSNSWSSDLYTLTATVVPLNQAPTLANAIPDQTASEDIAIAYQIPVNTFADADAGDVLTYTASLSNGAALPAWLSFSAATRTFTGIPNATTVGALNIKVTATDKFNASVTDTFAFNIAHTNHAPFSIGTSITTLEDTAYTFTRNDFGFSDTDSGDQLKAVSLVNLPAVGVLTLNGSVVSVGQSISITDITAGLFKFLPAANGNGAGYTGFDFNVTDGGLLSVTAAHVNVNVTPVYDPIMGTVRNDPSLKGTDADNDFIYGLAGKDVLFGLAGNDYLDGGSGIDRMLGGAGNDIYIVDNVKDVVSELANAGADEIRSAVNFTLPKNVENLLLIDGSAAKNATGNAQANTITGNQNANKIDGAAGNDLIFGGAGNDTLLGGLGNDVLYGEAGNDILDGGKGDDTFWFSGGAGQDVIKNFGDKAGNQDVIGLSDFVNIRFENLNITASGRNTIITIDSIAPSDFQITLTGVKAATIGADDFVF
jgi:Ca2+-binding RTX toxin-like protein